MMFEGMPWPLVLPIALAAMLWGSTRAKQEFSAAQKKAQKKSNKHKRN